MYTLDCGSNLYIGMGNKLAVHEVCMGVSTLEKGLHSMGTDRSAHAEFKTAISRC